jgi:serine/threonine protein kinase
VNPGPSPDWSEVERVMGAFLELPESQQRAYLARQPSVVRNEVESLLSARRGAGSFLQAGPLGPGITAELLGEMQALCSKQDGRGAGDEFFEVSPGTTLGPYRIESILGKGGMGVVYRALDTRLNRPVAVKFLSQALADAAARHRFQREAQMASALNHPHILTVYDAGDFEGRQYLVTEFVDGGTLKDWARKEVRTWREVVGLLTGVADGLAAAHAAGILHRDIKPDNILVGRNGYAKLSDFGLAKLEPTVPTGDRTQTMNATGPGIIMGTFAYMSPEQASGRPCDARSDLFSFGIVLYELLSGKRPFDGKTDRELLQNIIQASPAPINTDVPLPLRMVVEKALENAPSDRYQSARDLVVDLRRLTRQSGEFFAPSATPSGEITAPPRTSKFGAITIGVLLVALLTAAWILYRTERPATESPRQVVQFEITPPPGSIYAPLISRQSFAISPDGKRLAFSATGTNGTNIWVRDLASTDQRPIPGTDGAWSMFWSPDSRSIFYSFHLALKQVNLETGATRTVAQLRSLPMLGTWRANGDLVVFLGPGDLDEVHLDDGNVRKGPSIAGMRWPLMLPNLDRIIYASLDKSTQQVQAMAMDYAGGTPVPLVQTQSRPQYAPPLHRGDPGSLLYIRGGSLLAQPFDPNTMKLAGPPYSIAQNVIFYGANFSCSFSVSNNGVLVYQAGFPNAELKWHDRAGKEVGDVGRSSPLWGNVRVSHDGRRIAAAVWNQEVGGSGTWVFDANGKESRQFTFPPNIDRRPVWSPDGSQLAMARGRAGGFPLLATIDVNGNAEARGFENLSTHPVTVPTDWSSDGRFIAVDDGVGEEQRIASIADVNTHKIVPLLNNEYPQWGVAFAPDSKRIAFVSLQSGQPEVYVQAFEPAPTPHVTGEKHQVSRDGAWLVRWRADGRELFYLGLNNVIHAVAVQGPFQFSDPKPLFRVPGVTHYGTARDFQFDVSPDGQRFIFPNTGTVSPPPFTVIENWQEKFRN